ncbi:MAG: hypothetical protein C7B45_16895 [Sulfobacillus acidophilus]|uniref:DUF5666 domain-containing protein n=1 Tax=Sulfobacillus acidophilus TaxID=53633 RepID=A0A2T2WCS4_9FIRM|nr:MAG: hypothetical protein C7B45_16895 [Sulfobacillus acidophilus]
MAQSSRRHRFAVALMLGVTIVATAGLSEHTGSIASMQRFLAVDNHSGQVLMTVVTDAATTISYPMTLRAGAKVRVYGVQTGRTIHAQRIERMY